MYEFKLRINISGWLILALLLVILLCHFVPAALAAETVQYYQYGDNILPDIYSVYTPDLQSIYPYCFLWAGIGGYELSLSSVPLYYDNGYGLFPDASLGDIYLPSFIVPGSDVTAGWREASNHLVSYDHRLYGMFWANESLKNESDTVSYVYSPPVLVNSSSEPTGAVLPVFTVEPPLITWIEYNVGDSAIPVTVAAVVDDGGTISYTWYRTIFSDSGVPSNVEFSTGSTLVPDTSVVSDSSYYCVATNSNGQFSQSAYSRAYRVKVVELGAAEPPSETPTYPSAEDIGSSVGDAFQGVLDQNDINTSEQGNSFVDQITQIVPNESQGFVNAMGGLVDSLSYGGTGCVLTVPALVMPQIGDLVPQYTLLEKQTVDLESYFNMFPDFIVTLVQSLFTVALIVFCFKELYSTVSYFFVLRGGET